MTPPSGESLLVGAKDIAGAMVELRRAIYREPEIGLELPLTRDKIVGALGDLGVSSVVGDTIDSVTCIIEGNGPGPTVLLRADMDALDVTEEKVSGDDRGRSVTSGFVGRMHACGHDAHVAMLVGAASLLNAHRDDFSGSVLLFFQPGEEGWRGAQLALDAGLLDGPSAPTAAFALHVMPSLPTGVVATRPGTILASGAIVHIAVHGRGGHAALPRQCVDPVAALCHVVAALEGVMNRDVASDAPSVLSITGLETSSALPNVIPDEARAIGTLRTCGDGDELRLGSRLSSAASAVAEAFGAKCEMDIEPVYPITRNDDRIARAVLDVAGELVGTEAVRELGAPMMATEDFGFILERIPGAMAFLGVGGAGASAEPLHSPRLQIDEEAFHIGAALHAAVALRFLRQ
ncbi:MAG: M20 family metallopeptidase [Actinomycetota bacterium]|nr:M20 family metallopeptidase [Actinomycetota bacterium]